MYAVSEYPHQFRFSLSVNPPIQSVHSADGSLAAFPSQELIAVPEKSEIRTVLTHTCHEGNRQPREDPEKRSKIHCW